MASRVKLDHRELSREELQELLDLRRGSRTSRHTMKDRKKTRRVRDQAAIGEYDQQARNRCFADA